MNIRKFVPPRRLAREILSAGQRAMIRYDVQVFDPTGLFGQFPHQMKMMMSWAQEIDYLRLEAAGVIADLSQDSEFEKFFSLMSDTGLGWTVNEVLKRFGSNTPYRAIWIWSVNLGDNHNLGLFFTEDKKLLVGTDQFQHQGEHMEAFHWVKRHDSHNGADGLRIDSFRLYQALKILSDEKKARAYLRARAHAYELSD